jgi:hypothetical protein
MVRQLSIELSREPVAHRHDRNEVHRGSSPSTSCGSRPSPQPDAIAVDPRGPRTSVARRDIEPGLVELLRAGDRGRR